MVTHGVGTAYTPCSLLWSPRALHGRLLDGFLPLRRRAHASALLLTKCGCERRRSKTSREMQSEATGDREDLQARATALVYSTQRLTELASCPELRERCRIGFFAVCFRDDFRLLTRSRPRGLWASMRHPDCIRATACVLSTQRRCHKLRFRSNRICMEIPQSPRSFSSSLSTRQM